MDQEVTDARARLAAKFGKKGAPQLGGKGTQRRAQRKHNSKATTANVDNKIKSAIMKLGSKPLDSIDEVNMFMEDNTVIHFQRPEVTFQVGENMLSVTGQPETKQLKDLLPNILKQCGPQ